MVDGIRIDELDPELLPSLASTVAIMRNGNTYQMTVQQFADLITAILVDGAPLALDTLNEIAAAIANDENIAATLTALISANTTNANQAVRFAVAQVLTASQQAQARANISSPLKGHLNGLTLSNNVADATNDIDVAAGEAASTEAEPVLMVLAATMTKRLDAAWAPGSGNGGLDAGAIGNNTYHVWLIRNPTSGAVDVLFSLSTTAPTMPANYTQKRRIGSFVRSSGSIIAFRQSGHYFEIKNPTAVINAFAQTDAAALHTLSNVPTGLELPVKLRATVTRASSAAYVLISSPVQTDVDPVTGLANIGIGGSGLTAVNASSEVTAVTDTSARVRGRSPSGTTVTLYLTPMGWTDYRGTI